eukprot:m.147663 g.147663  ORF g.147663 m.147663 type:complete len:803 (+) comp38469_c0_seq27:566-2974(+)
MYICLHNHIASLLAWFQHKRSCRWMRSQLSVLEANPSLSNTGSCDMQSEEQKRFWLKMNIILLLAILTGCSAFEPRVMFWCGKVNQHIDLSTGGWTTDRDGVSGCINISATSAILNYCRKVYPQKDIIKVFADSQLRNSSTWCLRGNVNCHHTSLKPSFKCVARRSCWSPWMDGDDPSATGDYETIRMHAGRTCSRPLDIRCRTTITHKDARLTGETIVCNTAYGFECVNRRQRDGRCNFDYEASFLCPCSPPVPVRLAGGPTPNEGRVEVYHSGEWGIVCDDGWDTRDARVVCRQLGYTDAQAAKQRSQYGAGTGPMLIDDVSCLGAENNIGHCSFPGWKVHNCGRNEAAGVKCTPVSVRLAGGRTPNEGRVEVYHSDEWGIVCDDIWDIRDARVVCRQLGYSDARAATRNSAYGHGSRPMLMDNVMCSGTERNLGNCRFPGWRVHNCGSNEAAGVQCIGVGCSGPAAPSFGSVQRNGRTATFSCLPGFKLIGPITKICNGRRWNPQGLPRCQPVCPYPYPKNPREGNVRVSKAGSYWTASYRCNSGYSLVGNARRTCRDGGIWSGREPGCFLSDLVRLKSRPSCTFSNKLDEADSRCLYFNSKSDIEWQQEIHSNGKVNLRSIPQAHLPIDCPNTSPKIRSVQDAVAKEVPELSLRFRRTPATFKLVLSVRSIKPFNVKTATLIVGSFAYGLKYINFRLITRGLGLKYAVEAHAICQPHGHIDNLGSPTNEFKYMSVITDMPLSGDYSIKLKDTIDSTCRNFALQLSVSVMYQGPYSSIRLEAMPLGVSEKARGSVLNEG